VFIDYFVALKRNETARFARWLEEHGVKDSSESTEWEQSEYLISFENCRMVERSETHLLPRDEVMGFLRSTHPTRYSIGSTALCAML